MKIYVEQLIYSRSDRVINVYLQTNSIYSPILSIVSKSYKCLLSDKQHLSPYLNYSTNYRNSCESL